MENAIVSAILIFNIVLMLLYFIVKINKRSMDRAREAYSKADKEEEKKTLSGEDHEWISSFISDPTIPDSIAKNESFTYNTDDTSIMFVKKEELDKGLTGFGVIIKSSTHKCAINLLPISFLEVTRKNAFLLKNSQKNLIGLFTPFHIVIFNTETFMFSQSVEDDVTNDMEEIPLTAFTKENDAVDHMVVKVKMPFLDPCQFVESFYLSDYKDFKTTNK